MRALTHSLKLQGNTVSEITRAQVNYFMNVSCNSKIRIVCFDRAAYLLEDKDWVMTVQALEENKTLQLIAEEIMLQVPCSKSSPIYCLVYNC